MARRAFHTCHGGGRLVVALSCIPDDPADYAWSAALRDCGCNNLTCGRCGADVHASDEGTEPKTTRYACECGDFVIDTDRPLGGPFDMTMASELPEDWRCFGHPARKLPAELEGESVEAHPDWAAWIERSAAAALPSGELPPWLPSLPHIWLERLVATVAAEERERFAASASDAIARSEGEAGSVALTLAKRLELEPVARELAAAVAASGFAWGDAGRARAVVGLLRTAADARPDDETTIEALRRAVREAPGASDLLYRLAKSDAAWLGESAVELLREHPDYERTLLSALGEAGEVSALRDALRSLSEAGVGTRAELLRAVHRGIPDAERAELIAALGLQEDSG